MTRVCPENTIDSNVTGYAMAEEVCPGQLPTIEIDGYLPTWYEQEPNSYPATFGGKLKTVARAPIKRNRQQSKGTTVGQDVTAGMNSDYTMNNMLRHEQGFFFADVREKPTTDPFNSAEETLTSATASSHIFAGAGFGEFRALQIVQLEGSLHNDGIFTISAATPTAITVNEALVDETFAGDVVLRVVGEHYAAGGISLTAVGALGTLHNAGADPVAATGVYTISAGNAADGDTVTIGDTVYTFRTAAPAVAGEVMIGASITTAAANLAATINGLSTLTPANDDVSATSLVGVMTVTAKLKGASENSIVTTEAGANTAWGSGTLTGGAGHSLLALGIIPGEWFFLGGDTANHHFANNIGYARCGSISDTDIVMDRTSWDVAAEAAGALTIDIFTGMLLQNENDPTLIKKRSYQGQRTLGQDADGTMSQYLTGLVPNTLKLNIPLEAKLEVDLAWIGQTEEFRTGAQGLKAGTLVPALDEDAINSSNDIFECAMTVISLTDSNPTKLFGFLSAADIQINNNVSSIKGISKLGGIGENVGLFTVSGTATAYFTDIAANIAITNNDDVDLHFICAKHNKGFVYDISLLTLGSSGIVIASNKPITIPLTTEAAQGVHGATLTKTTFQYLPALAMPVQS